MLFQYDLFCYTQISGGRDFAEVQCFQLVPNPTMSEKEVIAFIADTYFDRKQEQQQQQNVAECINLSSLRTLQRLLLRILRDYWLNKWLLHRQSDDWLRSSPTDDGNEEEEEEEMEGKKEERFEMHDEATVEQLKNELDKMVKGRFYSLAS